MPNPTRRAILAGLSAGALATACGAGDDTDDAAGADIPWPTGLLTITVPADPGGGWDLTGRSVQRVVEQTRLTESGVAVKNVPGAGGTVGLTQYANERNTNTLMVMGYAMVGSIAVQNTTANLQDVTPLARITGEYSMIAVPADSPMKTLGDFVDAIKNDPKKTAIGGDPPGATDSLMISQFAQEVGVNPRDLNYTGYEGGGALSPSLIGGELAVGVSGVSEFLELVDAGRLRALAVSAPERMSVAPDVPTYRESDVDYTFTNWRGVVGPGSMSPQQQDQAVEFMTQIRSSEGWRKALITNGWDDVWLTGDEFAAYIATEQDRTDALVERLGLKPE